MNMQGKRAARGFTLIEVLVGVGIGLIGILVMFRMIGLWDTHTRSTSSGSDAQVAGTLAIFNLERDVKQAGMGFGRARPPFMGCNVAATDTNSGRVFNFPMLPVNIIPGAAGAPDQIHTLYGNSSFYVEEQTFRTSAATTKTTVRRGGFRRGDLAIVAGNESALPASATCALIQVTDDTNPDNLTLAHANGNYTNFYAGALVASRFNPVAGTGGVYTAGRVYSLGPTPQLNIWQIGAGGVLTRSDLIHDDAPAFDVAERVINLKAEYGIDTNADLRVDSWTAVPPADWTTALALRAAVLIRSKQFERSLDPNTGLPFAVTPTAANPCWANCDAAHTFVMTNVDGTADAFGNANPDPNNWRYYRYRVYERVIPLRNMIWGTSP